MYKLFLTESNLVTIKFVIGSRTRINFARLGENETLVTWQNSNSLILPGSYLSTKVKRIINC